MKKVLVALIALLVINVSGMAQAATTPVKKAEDKMKAVPAKPTVAAPAKVVEMPKSLSKTPPAVQTPKAVVAKTPTAKPAAAAPATPVTLKKDGTPDKRYKTATGPTKKDGTPDLRFKKNKKG
jgi:hypothetical protein